MLERRVSNQQNVLSNSQQLNYLLAWFQDWSDLMKEDFVPVLAEKMSSKWAEEHQVNGLSDDMEKLGRKQVSLFQCQVKLFRDWVLAWSDDQKNYLILRLKEIDQTFSRKYEHYLEFGKQSPERDYFEPGIPPELDLSIDRSSEVDEGIDTSLKEVESTLSEAEEVTKEAEETTNFENENEDDLCKGTTNNNVALLPLVEESPSEALGTETELSEKVDKGELQDVL